MIAGESPKTGERNRRMLLIGVGNEFRTDDGLGPLVAREICRRSYPGLEVRESSGDGVGLLHLMQDADTVLLVDAIHSGSAPGTMHRVDTSSEEIPASLFPTSTHGFGIPEALEAGRLMQALPQTIILYGIEGESFDYGTGLSETVLKSVKELLAALEKDIVLLSGPSGGPAEDLQHSEAA